jgi:trehalose synthase
MLDYGIQPTRFVHGLQNHDELMLELTHLRVNGTQIFEYEGNRERGDSLFKRIHEDVIAATTGDQAPYNQAFAMSPGVCSTLPGLIAAALGIQDSGQISPQQKEQIVQVHLMAAAFNALQGGVFLLSGWDLVGALPIPAASVGDLVADNDYRWINRGGYDLLGTADSAERSIQGLPKARSLYGSLTDQLEDEGSFTSRLKSMLTLRNTLDIARSELASVPTVEHEGVVIMVNKLQGQPQCWQITALNFSRSQVEQRVCHPGMVGVAEVRWTNRQGVVSEDISSDDDSVTVELQAMEAKLIVVSEFANARQTAP